MNERNKEEFLKRFINKSPKTNNSKSKSPTFSPKLKNLISAHHQKEEIEESLVQQKPKISSHSKELALQKFKREALDEKSKLHAHFEIKKQKQTSESTKSTVNRSSTPQKCEEKKESHQQKQLNEEELKIGNKQFKTPCKKQKKQNDSEKSKQKSYYVPLYERYKIEMEMKKEKIEELRKKNEQQNYKSPKRKKQQIESSNQQKQQQNWKEKQQNYIMKVRMERHIKDQEECTYHPKITKKSEILAKRVFTSKGNLKTEDRLLEYQNEISLKRLDKQFEEENKLRYTIQQSPLSRKINSRRSYDGFNRLEKDYHVKNNNNEHSNQPMIYLIGNEYQDVSDQF